MQVSATEAKNRLGQMLEHCQREPVIIEKNGRRHSVLVSAAQYEALLMQAQGNAPGQPKHDAGRDFYAKYKLWVDEQNRLVEQFGIPGEDFRAW